MTSNAPFLAQLCGPSKPQQPLPPLTTGHDGLLRRAGIATPFIDELPEDSAAPGPNLVGAGWRRAMVTDIQKSFPMPDPDLIRHAGRDYPALNFGSDSGIDQR